MRVWSLFALTALATAPAACGGSSGTASDDGGGTGIFTVPGVDAATGLDSSSSALDAPLGIPSPDSAIPGTDATMAAATDAATETDATTGTDGGVADGSAADAPEADASETDATSGAESGGGEDASPDATAADAAAKDSAAGMDSGPEASAPDAAEKDSAAGMDSGPEASAPDAAEKDSAAGMDSGPEASAPDAAPKDAAMEATTVNCSGTAPTGGTKECSDGSGTVNGNSWTLWQSGSGGCMTPYGVGAAFGATWGPNSDDFLAREGLQWNSTQSYTALGTITATFSETKTGSAGGYSYVGIYGWSENPLHEYYIVEDWYGAGPPNPGGTLMGTITVDGGTYNVYTHTQTNQPAITGGNATFVQFFSVRQTARQCGTISISEHFSQWNTMGMTLGNMEEAKLLIEAGGGTGTITFATGTVTATN
jgi:endo-1,4-beta-xylanase